MKKYNISNLLSKPVAGSRQKGASSLEYLMLGGVIVIILGAVLFAGSDIGETIVQMFKDLIGEAKPE